MELSVEDRVFFERITTSLFTNPFSSARFQADARAVNMSWHDDRSAVIEALLAELAQRLDAIRPASLDVFSGRDAECLLYAILFWCLHTHWESFEALIQRQLLEGSSPVEATVGLEIVEQLESWRVSRQRAIRFVGMFHQIHRAYRFIGDGLPGQSPSVFALRERLWVNVFSHDLALYFDTLWNRLDDFSTFLIGASGTGKGTAAMALGQSGWIPYDIKRKRFARSFMTLLVPINLSQFPDSLIESELFGHAKGAFTGAIRTHEGVFSRCQEHGTLFLDEIGEVAEHIQVKLLNVLQERTYSPVGTHQPRPFVGRIIAATNRPMAQVRSEEGLRDDFYYRLCSDVIIVPTLRQRLNEDEHELERLVRAIVTSLVGASHAERLTRLVLESLSKHVPHAYDWPGNIRELEQAVRRIILTGQMGAVEMQTGALSTLTQGIEQGTATLEEVTRLYCCVLYERLGSYQEVARRLGLDRRTVSKHVRGA